MAHQSPSILFLAKRKASASTRYRCLHYFPFLERAGFKPEHINTKGGLIKKFRILYKVKKADAVVVARKTFTWPFRSLVHRCSKNLIFDFDDAIFVRSSGEKSVLRQSRFKAMLKRVDHVWAGNRYLETMALKYCPSVEVLPTAVDLDRYHLNTEKSENHIDIVWIGSSSTKKYLKRLIPVLDKAAELFPGIRLKIIADFDLETRKIKTVPIAWSEETEGAEIGSSHIGISMMTEDPWSNGKCGLKVIQYMAASLPVIATNNGAHKEIIEHEKSGVLVNNEAEWLDALSDLIKNKEKRDTLGQRGFETVTQRYSLETTSQQMIDSLNRLIRH